MQDPVSTDGNATMSHKLTADELGNVGEAKFKVLCGQAQLICNESSRDRTGWDFIVEFPMDEPGPLAPLDQRAPNACHVQLKSTGGEDGSRISVRLSSIERLAKDARPAVVIVFHLAPDGEGIAGYIIHLLGDSLSRVLRSLRLAHAKKETDVNHKRISFDYRKFGTRFDLTPQGLRNALANVCGTDPAGYVVKKQRQLAALGYENGHLEGKVLFRVESREHLINVLLGLAPIKPERLSLADSRFGILLPYKGPLLERLSELTFDPPFAGSCEVSFRGPSLYPAAIFTCEMLVSPPAAAIGGPHVLIRHPDFTLILDAEASRFQTTGNFVTSVRSLQRWIDLVRALSHVTTSGGSIHIRYQEVPAHSFGLQGRLDGPCVEQLPQLLQFLNGWRQLLSIAGIQSTAQFSLEDIWNSSQAQLAVDILLSREPISYFSFQLVSQVSSGPTVEALYYNSCKLAAAAISYAARMTLQRTSDAACTYRSVAFTPLDVRPAVHAPAEYAKEQAAQHGLSIVIDPANITYEDLDGGDDPHEPGAENRERE